MEKPKLIISDIDGCITSGIFEAFNLEKVQEIRQVVKENGVLLTFSSGRPKPYVEAVLQLFESKTPGICESGGVIIDPVPYTNIYLKPRITTAVREIEEILAEKVVPGRPAFIEPGKSASVGIMPNDFSDPTTSHEIATEINNMKNEFPCPVECTVASNVVCILPDGTSKEAGMQLLLERLGIDTADVLAIGDAKLDVGFMNEAGIAACPANSDEASKSASDYVSTKNDIEGVLDIVKHFCA